MLRLTALCFLLGALPAAAAEKAADKKPAAPVRGEADDEEDDDILAPVRDPGDKAPTTAVPVKAKDLKVGLLPLVPLGETSKTLGDQLTSELTKAFNESASVEVVALTMSSGTGAAVTDIGAADAAKKEGDELLGKANALLAKLNFGKAKKGYELALAAFEKAAPVLETPTPLIDAWLGLAEVAARQAQDDETRRCLGKVVALNPELELDKKRFPGLFLNTHRKVRDSLLKGERARVFVDETGTGAQVVIDGRPTTTAPARLSGLLPGSHLVRALREGQAPWGTIVVVEASAEATVSPGFLAKDKKGPGEDLAQNKLSPEAAAVVAEAAKAQGIKGAVVGAITKDGGKVMVQLVFVDAATGKVALLPPTTFQAALLDIGIESLKARARLEELASTTDVALFVAADADEPLIAGANAGAGVTVSELAIKYDVKVSKDAPASREVRGVDDGEERAPDEDAERTVAESKAGSRKRLDEEKDPYAGRGSASETEIDEDTPMTEQGWFLPTVVTAGIVGAVAVLAGTGFALVGFGVIPDPRAAAGAQVNVAVPSAAP
ncbi:MAG: PEGA domain-containing protein [Deltaproteobacteria bacterium]|nr:PEGA domain-containing protein [Deltaproteobacteria bacterium]